MMIELQDHGFSGGLCDNIPQKQLLSYIHQHVTTAAGHHTLNFCLFKFYWDDKNFCNASVMPKQKVK